MVRVSPVAAASRLRCRTSRVRRRAGAAHQRGVVRRSGPERGILLLPEASSFLFIPPFLLLRHPSSLSSLPRPTAGENPNLWWLGQGGGWGGGQGGLVYRRLLGHGCGMDGGGCGGGMGLIRASWRKRGRWRGSCVTIPAHAWHACGARGRSTVPSGAADVRAEHGSGSSGSVVDE